MTKFIESNVQVNGEMLYKKVEEPKVEPEKPFIGEIRVKLGQVYGGGSDDLRPEDWKTFHIKKVDCKGIRVREIMPDEIVLSQELIKRVFYPGGQKYMHEMSTFMSAVVEELSK